jgi:hypothetical protein
LNGLLAKLERQISNAPEAPGSDKPLYAKLAAVKLPSDLAAIAMDLSQRQPRFQRSEKSRTVRRLVKQLSKLAAAWSAEDMNLLPIDDARGEGLDRVSIAALRERIEREIVSRWAEAPELNQAPFANLPLPDAVDGFQAKLAAEGKWRQALRLLQTQRVLRDVHGAAAGPRNPETIFAVRSFLTGVSLEEAGLWTEAAGAYKSVLAADMENTPIPEAAARLKVLAKEHSGEVKAAGFQLMPELDR